MYIDSTADAGKYVSRILEGRGYSIVNVKPVNKGRHIIIVAERMGERIVKYVIHKKEFFITFSRQFNLEKGIFGETVNLEYFSPIAKAHTPVEMLFCYPDGVIYSTDPKTWGDFVKENNTIRITQSQGETTTSVPISLLLRWDKNWTTSELSNWCVKSKIPRNIIEKLLLQFQKLKDKLFGDKK